MSGNTVDAWARAPGLARATLWFVLLAAAATAPALGGWRSLGSEGMLDGDLLYRVGDAPPSSRSIPDLSRTVYDLPRDFAAADGLRHGRFDLWNPLVSFGVPLWAEGGGPFFPLKVPFYLFPSLRTYDVATALRLVVAGLGAYFLARRRGLPTVPAIAAGSLFELSGAMMTLMPFGSGAPPCLLPWALLGAEVIARERRTAAAAGAGIALGLAAGAGHPMLALAVFAAFGAAILGEMLSAWRSPRGALITGALGALAVAIGLAIGAPTLLPLLELQSVGRLYKHVGSYADKTALWLAFGRHLLPLALFAPFTLSTMEASFPTTLPYLWSPVIGLMGLVLAIAGFLRRRLSAGLLAVAVLGVATTLAPPGLYWIHTLPLLREIWPCYCWSLVAVVMSQAAGDGVATLEIPGERRLVLIALAVAIASSSLLLVVSDYDYMPAEVLIFTLPVRQAFLGTLASSTGWVQLLMPPILATTALVAVAAGRSSRWARGRAVVITALATLELLAVLAPASWFVGSNVLTSPPSPAVRFLQERLAGGDYRMHAVPMRVGHPSTLSLFGLRDVRGIAALPAERYVRYLEAISPFSNWFFAQHPAGARHPLLDLAAVRFVARPADPEPPPTLEGDAAVLLVYRDRFVAIYENTAALPRARIVRTAVPVRDQEEAFARLKESAGAATHAAESGLIDRIFIEPSDDGTAAPSGSTGTATPGDTVRIIEVGDPDRVDVAVSLANPGWLVLADTFYPGWTATIDGAPAAIHPADLLFRAVLVSAGDHRVVFRYEPTSFRLGLVFSMLGVAASTLLILRSRRVRG